MTNKKKSSMTGQKKTSKTQSKTNSTLSKNLEKLTTQPKQSKKSTTTSQTKSKKNKKEKLQVINTTNQSLFPYQSFPYYLEDKSEKKKCYFQCEQHAQKYITRYNPEYKLYLYTG